MYAFGELAKQSSDYRSGGGGPPPTSPSLESPTPSFFSLAHCAGFCSPLAGDSGQRSFVRHHETATSPAAGAAATTNRNSSSTTGSGGRHPAATCLFAPFHELKGRRGQAQEVPIVHPKASHLRLSEMPPLPNAPSLPSGVITISTRGSQRHHLAFSDSPPPPGPAASLSGVRTPLATSAESAFFAPPSREAGDARDGLHTSFGLLPSMRLASRLTPAEGPAAGKQSTPSPMMAAARSSASLMTSFVEFGQRLSPPVAEAQGGAPTPTSYDRDAVWSSRSPRKNAVEAAALSLSGPQSPPHRYREADEEAHKAAAAGATGGTAVDAAAGNTSTATSPSTPPSSRTSHTNPPSSLTVKKPIVATTSTTTAASPAAAAHKVTDCTSGADRWRNNSLLLQSKPEHRQQKLTSNPLLRRPSVSAEPLVPAGWLPEAKGHRSRTAADTSTTTTTAAAAAAASGTVAAVPFASGRATEEVHRPVAQMPQRLTFTPPEDRSHNLDSHASTKTRAPQQHAVRFIYTRSRSGSKAASPEHPLLPAFHQREEAHPTAVTLSALSTHRQPPPPPKQQSQHEDTQRPVVNGPGKTRRRSAGAPAAAAFMSLRRHTKPSHDADTPTRRSAAFVPFSRSATTATVREREREQHRPSQSAMKVREDSRRQQSTARGEKDVVVAAVASGGRGSWGSMGDFDAAPQSYLMQWRERQEMKRAKSVETTTATSTTTTAATAVEVAESAAAEGADANAEKRVGRSTSTAAVVAAAEATDLFTRAPSAVTSPPPPPLTTEAHTPAVKAEEVKAQLSARATNASWRRGREENTTATAAAAAAPALTSHAEEPPPALNVTAAAAEEVPTKPPQSAYSLRDALHDSSLPTAAASIDAPPTVASAADEGVVKPEPKVPQRIVATMPGAPQHRLPVALVETQLSTTPTTSHHRQHHRAMDSEATFLTALSVGSSSSNTTISPTNVHNSSSAGGSMSHSNPSPLPSDRNTRKASQSSSGVYMAEECTRRASISEEIPADQVSADAALPAVLKHEGAPTAAASIDVPQQVQGSPRRPSRADPVDGTVSAARTSVEQRLASRTLSIAASTHASRASSARPSTTGAAPSGTDSAMVPDSARGRETPGGRDVRDIFKSVLERREQRQQQQQQSSGEGDSARHPASGLETPLLPLPTPQPLPTLAEGARHSVPLQHLQQQTPSTGAGVGDTRDIGRSSPLLNSASARRATTTLSTSYTPPWRVGASGGAALHSRPHSAAPEAAPAGPKTTATAASAFTTPATTTASLSTRPLPSTVTPEARGDPPAAAAAASVAHSRVTSIATPAPASPHQQQQQVVSALPSRCTTPRSFAGTTSTTRDGRTSTVLAPVAADAAAPSSDTEGEDDDKSVAASATTRISQLLARRTSFTHRLSVFLDVTAAAVDGPASASHSAQQKESVASPPAEPAAAALDASRPSLSFDMATAREAIPTAADIEREAKLAQHQQEQKQETEKESKEMEAAGEAVGAAVAPKDSRATAPPQPKPLTIFAAPPSPRAASTSPPPPPIAEPSPPPAVEVTSAPTAALAEIRIDELDKLERSVNAMLKYYGAAAAHRTPEKSEPTAAGGTSMVKKQTAADLLLSQMPARAVTSTAKKVTKAAAQMAQTSATALKATTTAMEKSGSQRRSWQHGEESDCEDEDAHWDPSLLWCGEESGASDSAPPSCVPPLDLTSILVPTNAVEDLKPYRIPLPSAVVAVEESRRQLLRLSGLRPNESPVFAEVEEKQDGTSRCTSGAFPPSASSSSALGLPNQNSPSLPDLSSFQGERIRTMREQPVEPSARQLRVSRRSSAAAATATITTAAVDPEPPVVDSVATASGDGEKAGGKVPAALSVSSSEDGEAADSIHDLVDEAPQRISRVVRFTDDSDALDGGRGAARDLRLGQQKSRVRALLLDCEEQRERKVVMAEEQGAFVVIGKSFRRSSLLQ